MSKEQDVNFYFKKKRIINSYIPDLKSRWRLELTPSKFIFLLNKEYSDEHELDWEGCTSQVYGIFLNKTKELKIEQRHIYYEGTHCSFRIGRISFCWYNPKCKKCIPDSRS